ncbi:MAG: DUF342 domain-containing protein [Wujia sp.]
MEKDWVKLNIDENRMWVTLSIKQPEGEEAPYFSPEFIEAYLRENGITSGICKEAIEALANNVAYGIEVEVARGKFAVDGKDGFYQYTVMTEDAKSKPVINSDGSVDYYNSLKLAMIQKDQLFAVYVPATSGEYGYTVFSEMLAPVKGRELRPLRGKGFYVSEDGREYRASMDGRLIRNNEHIIVEPFYLVKGDLDIEQGNIVFNGDVEIKGDVRSGLTIETDGSIFIHGHVGGCILKAGKDITIKKGVQGRNKCEIIAGGNVMCSFIERCNIVAQGNVYADSILDSYVVSYKQVIVSSKKGLIVGGYTAGMLGITVREAGNDAGIGTELQIGVMKDRVNRFMQLSGSMKKLQSEIEILDKYLKTYDALEGDKRTKETEATRMKLLRAKVIKNTEMKNVQNEYVALEEELEEARKAELHITGTAHEGIRVIYGHQTRQQNETWKDIGYKIRNNEIILISNSQE